MHEQNTFFKTGSETLRRSRNFIFFGMLIYSLAAIAGWVHSDNLEFPEHLFKELVTKFEGLNPFEFVARIFLHNLIASYLAMCFITLLGIIPLFMAVFNGLILGWFAGWMENATWLELFMLLAPHGVFEWTAMFMAFGVGMWRGTASFFSPDGLTWKERWKKANCAYFAFVVPLLMVAAIIEGRYHFREMLS